MAGHDSLSPDRQRQILKGAARVFAQDGYEGASMSRIAAEAGVSKGTLYNYFEGKKELFAAFVQRVCERDLAPALDDLDGLPAEEALTRVGRSMITMLLSDAGMLIYRMVVSEARNFPELAEAFYEAGPRVVTRRLAAWIAAERNAGRLTLDDPELAAEQLFCLMQARIVIRRRLHIPCESTEEDREQVIKWAVRLFLRGYSAGQA